MIKMTDVDEFDLTPVIEGPLNTFKIVHIYNRSDTYHLTRQVLFDSILTQNTYCFFYHILAKGVDEFNDIYGSFAFLIARNEIEADIYLNVDSKALYHIIQYIQTGKINTERICESHWKTKEEIIDLATMFGIPNLVSLLRNIVSSEENINDTNEIIFTIKHINNMLSLLYKKYNFKKTK